ncbi:hypothetical protein NQ318_004695 [Aromia moschata]|uniref:Uncharacterized protein n=1 Tax=Aromia moschata TaxID=1265417 RepID=A0AAV8XHQ0_9CUCU|nr:hypothetical protein NQ318_004695 [Aromia moschata]
MYHQLQLLPPPPSTIRSRAFNHNSDPGNRKMTSENIRISGFYCVNSLFSLVENIIKPSDA